MLFPFYFCVMVGVIIDILINALMSLVDQMYFNILQQKKLGNIIVENI